jgi:thiol-disulfide isomerase/thioredoxin
VAFIALLRRKMRSLAPPELEAPPLPSTSWDYSLDAHDLAGEPVSSAQFRDRVVVLNFWATWCRPCIAEMPSFFRLREATSEAGVVFAFLSSESPDVLTGFNAQHGWTGPFYRLLSSPPDCFSTRAIPATYIIDRSGNIAFKHFGAARWDDQSVVTFLNQLALSV